MAVDKVSFGSVTGVMQGRPLSDSRLGRGDAVIDALLGPQGLGNQTSKISLISAGRALENPIFRSGLFQPRVKSLQPVGDR